MSGLPAHLAALEAESIHILREGIAEARHPVLLFSGGKDSTVLAHLALRAFHPAPARLPLLHIDSTWEFREVLAFRDDFAARHDFELHVHANELGRAQSINPFEHGDVYTTMMRTEPLKQALQQGGYDVIFGGARRDEESSRSKERIVSLRNVHHGWEPRAQRPEFWHCFNGCRKRGETLRVFPLSNWTEQNLWEWIMHREIEVAPLYLARERPVVLRDGMRIVVDEPHRMHWLAGEQSRMESVRFRTLGCWPVTAAEPSRTETLAGIAAEMRSTRRSERAGRVGDGSSLERQKREGYF